MCSLAKRPMCVKGAGATFCVGIGELGGFATLTLPLTFTFPEICPVPCKETGSGVFITVTGAVPELEAAGAIIKLERARIPRPAVAAKSLCSENIVALLSFVLDEQWEWTFSMSCCGQSVLHAPDTNRVAAAAGQRNPRATPDRCRGPVCWEKDRSTIICRRTTGPGIAIAGAEDVSIVAAGIAGSYPAHIGQRGRPPA